MGEVKPWEEEWSYVTNHCGTYAEFVVGRCGYSYKSIGDARMDLASSAPDLYRALARFVKESECLCKGNIIPGGPCRHEQARAALRKARGE